jgi:redox-sensitive bicupin YhaK (pirin superfamily)
MIELVIPPRPRDLGEGMTVRRALPFAKKRMVGPFIFWDHMGPVEVSDTFEMLVRAHPHIGLATLTYLFSGKILHRDSLGNELEIKAGEVNWMTSGKGIVHSERASVKLGQKGILEGIQLWVALPQSEEKCEPDFVHFDAHDLPCFTLHHKWRLIAGEYQGIKSPVPVKSPLFYFESLLNGKETFQFEKGHESALYVAHGSLEIQGQKYSEGELIVLKMGAEVSVEGNECRLLVFGGEPFPEGRVIWWNLVASNQELIDEAKIRWSEQSMGQVIHETDFIPLPEI